MAIMSHPTINNSTSLIVINSHTILHLSSICLIERMGSMATPPLPPTAFAMDWVGRYGLYLPDRAGLGHQAMRSFSRGRPSALEQAPTPWTATLTTRASMPIGTTARLVAMIRNWMDVVDSGGR